MSSKAIVVSELDLSKISYSNPKTYSTSHCINVLYDGRSYLNLQTPICSSFGMTKNDKDNKYSMTILFNTPEEDKTEITLFENQMKNLEEKIISDIVKDEKKQWKKILNLDSKYDNLKPEVKTLMIENKLGNHLVKEPKTKDKGYSNQMNVKIRDYGGSIKLDTYLMNEKKSVYMDSEKPDTPKLYDPFEFLYRNFNDKKPPLTLIGIINFAIWVVNGNIYISPSMNQVIVSEGPKKSQKVLINEKGIEGFVVADKEEEKKSDKGSSSNEDDEEEEVEEEVEEDEEEPQIVNIRR
jgi:hypothetical protein